MTWKNKNQNIPGAESRPQEMSIKKGRQGAKEKDRKRPKTTLLARNKNKLKKASSEKGTLGEECQGERNTKTDYFSRRKREPLSKPKSAIKQTVKRKADEGNFFASQKLRQLH